MSEIDPTQHLGLVYSIVAKMSWSDRGALGREDLVQAGMLGLIRAANRHDGSTAFSTYAYPCILSEIYDELRRSSNTVRVPRNPRDPNKAANAPLARAAWSEVRGLTVSDGSDSVDLRRDVGRLGQPLRGVLEDYFFNDLSMDEIAFRMGRTRSRVQQMVHQGLDQLRRKMGIDSPPKKRLASRSPLRIHSLTAGVAMCAS